MKKQLIKCILLMFVIYTIIPSTSWATSDVEYGKFMVNNKIQKIAIASVSIDSQPLRVTNNDVPPLLINNRTLIPLKLVSENLGADITWNSKTEEVTIKKLNKLIILKINNSVAKVNGETKNLPDKVAPIIVNSRTMVPLKFIADEFSLTVNYNSANKTTDLISVNNIDIEDAIFSETSAVSEQDILSNLDLSGVNVINNSEATIDNNQINNELINITPELVNNTNLPEAIPNQISYNLIQNNLDNETLELYSGSNFKSTNFYLSSPERLVFDIYNVKINNNLDANKLYTSSVLIKEMNSFYYEDEQKLRITLKLHDNIKREEIQIIENPTSVEVKYKSNKPINSNLLYTSDRVNTNLEIKLSSFYKDLLINIDIIENTIDFTLPNNITNFESELKNIDDRNVSYIEIVNLGNESKVIIKLKERVKYHVVETGFNSKINIKLSKESRQMPLIVIDAGHGAKDPGAVAAGVKEKDLNLIIYEKLTNRLTQEGYEVIATRENDVFIELVDRAELANNEDADLFLSIHHNAAGSSSANGIETLYYPTEDNKSIAKLFHEELVKATKATDRKIISRANLVVLNKTKVPSLLLELGYMTNQSELNKIVNDNYQNIIVEAIVTAVNSYFGKN